MIHGLKIYQPQKEYSTLFTLIKRLSITHLFISRELAEDSNFLSQVPPHIEVALIFPVLFDSEGVLKKNPEASALTKNGICAKDEWVQFICPNQHQLIDEKLQTYLAIARKTKVQYLSIDFIRYFAFWEKTTPENAAKLLQTCFCPKCLKQFSLWAEVTLTDGSVTEKAEQILVQYEKEFIEYKCHTITSITQKIIAQAKSTLPQIKTALHLVPWQQGEFCDAIRRITGQNIDQLAPLVDLITPMCYAHMLNKSPKWIEEYLTNIQEKSTTPILPSIQVSHCYRDNPIEPETFRAYIKACKESGSEGVLYWSGEELLKEFKKQEIARYSF